MPKVQVVLTDGKVIDLVASRDFKVNPTDDERGASNTSATNKYVGEVRDLFRAGRIQAEDGTLTFTGGRQLPVFEEQDAAGKLHFIAAESIQSVTLSD